MIWILVFNSTQKYENCATNFSINKKIEVINSLFWPDVFESINERLIGFCHKFMKAFFSGCIFKLELNSIYTYSHAGF